MNWNDGLSAEMNKYVEEVLNNVGDISIESVKKAVDDASKTFYKDVINAAPVKTGGLQKSFIQEDISTPDFYGNINTFKGSDPSGVPYEKIANILNYGTKDGKINPTYFYTKAIRKLKSIDKNINKIYEEKLKELDDRS